MRLFFSVLPLCSLCLCGELLGHEPDRSPIDLAVLPDGRRVLTANHTADSVSLLDIETGKVLAEQACGRKPAGVACSADGKHAAVSNLWSGTVSLLDVHQDNLKTTAEVAVGPLPRGLMFSLDGAALYVAVAGRDEVVQLDTKSQQITQRWPAPREPRHLALSTDGQWLAAASSRSGQVRIWSTVTRQRLWERTIEDGFNLRGLAFTPDGQSLVVAHGIRREFPVSKENIEQGWVIDSRLTRLPLTAGARPPAEQVALDTRGRAVGDPYGAAFSADGRWLAVTGSGTHELLLFDAAALPWTAGDPGDFLDARLAKDDGKFRRLPLEGRPLTVAPLPRCDAVVVANYLRDEVDVVDVKAGQVLHRVPLGGPAPPSLARQGEALFYDAQRSHHQWFSCSTCHVEGHTCGLKFDTLNDDSYGNPKLTPTLRNVTQTGPWTWHGWQTDLGAGIEKSLTQTMYGPKPTGDETRALRAFLATLTGPPSPNPGSEAARRGQALFHGKAHCARCHKGDHYTSESNYDVKLEPDGSPYRLWNPPSLRGLWDRGPYLHDGRAATLDDLLRQHHAPEKLGGQELSPAERADLIEFLKSL
jgi:YVTN family beta-propeller protein